MRRTPLARRMRKSLKFFGPRAQKGHFGLGSNRLARMLSGSDCPLRLQIQALGDDQQILSKFPQRAPRRPLFGSVAQISQPCFSERARELALKGI
jgi:hypothetical protein